MFVCRYYLKKKKSKFCQPKNTNCVNQSWPSYVNYGLLKFTHLKKLKFCPKNTKSW